MPAVVGVSVLPLLYMKKDFSPSASRAGVGF